jgi:hypothetical protein
VVELIREASDILMPMAAGGAGGVAAGLTRKAGEELYHLGHGILVKLRRSEEKLPTDPAEFAQVVDSAVQADVVSMAELQALVAASKPATGTVNIGSIVSDATVVSGSQTINNYNR